MLTVTRRFTFDSAHRLPRHEGKCSRLHGHTYSLEVEVTSPRLVSSRSSDQGMIVDFKELKKAVDAAVIEKLDHHNINETVQSLCFEKLALNPDEDNVTTAEILVVKIAEALRAYFGECLKSLELVRVRLGETQDSWAEWQNTDILVRGR